ncbi:hypothetical protein [Herbiconiux liangxiaofengii]|uniref:hypothetical protein n=1 Tax=Herbiconiux liangxiaofengii TaxID=3342795 RepID=UPI0035B9F8A2
MNVTPGDIDRHTGVLAVALAHACGTPSLLAPRQPAGVRGDSASGWRDAPRERPPGA